MGRIEADGRALTIDGTFNVRDLGGLRTRTGGAVARGLVYRSGDLGQLSAEGADQLQALGLATVVDLRRPSEIVRHGRFAFERLGIAYRHRPLLDTSAAEPEARPAELPADALDQLYRRIADEGAPNVAQVLNWLGEPDALPAVVHCVAGKDRTGSVVALLLALLDVADEEIAADYTLSAAELTAYRGRDERAAAWLAQVPPVLLGADLAAMPSFLTWLRHRHGSVAAYARSAGVQTDALDRLRARLVTQAPT